MCLTPPVPLSFHTLTRLLLFQICISPLAWCSSTLTSTETHLYKRWVVKWEQASFTSPHTHTHTWMHRQREWEQISSLCFLSIGGISLLWHSVPTTDSWQYPRKVIVSVMRKADKLHGLYLVLSSSTSLSVLLSGCLQPQCWTESNQ